MSSFIVNQAEPVSVKILHNDGSSYKLKLKINVEDTTLSTGKLVDAKKIVYKLAQGTIVWQEFKSIPATKVPKLIRKSSSSIHFQLAGNPGSFQVTISFGAPNKSLPDGYKGILSVSTLSEYLEFYYKNGRQNQLALDSNDLVNVFTDINSLSQKDRNEIIHLFEFINSADDRKRVADKLLDTRTLEPVIRAIRDLVKREGEAHRFLRKELLSGSVRLFAETSLITDQELDEMTNVFEDLEPEDQGHYIDTLINACQPATGEKIVQTLTETWERLQRAGYRLASNQRAHPNSNSTQIKSLVGRLSPSAILSIIKGQIEALENETHPLDISTAICHLTCINTLLEIAVSSDVKHLSKETTFKPIYEALSQYKKRNWFIRFTKCEESRFPNYDVAFLARHAIQTLLLIGHDENPTYTVLCKVFRFIRGVATLAASVNIDQPWGVLKGIFDAGEDFYAAFKQADKKIKPFLSLNFLTATFLSSSKDVKDFLNFANDLLNPALIEQNKKVLSGYCLRKPKKEKSSKLPKLLGKAKTEKKLDLSLHTHRFFVMGLIRLLHNIYRTYDGQDKDVKNKVIKLLEMIKDNNKTSSDAKAEIQLFRIQSKKKTSTLRDFVIAKIDNLLADLNAAPVATDIKEEDLTQIKSRLFEPVFRNKFPWIEALRLQDKSLCEDRDLKENQGYTVQLKGSEPKQGKKPIEELVDSVLDNGQKVTVIVGEAGSGKSLFVKSYVKGRLDKYQIDKPMPFFTALRTIKDPEKNLILEILKQYNLGRDDIERLKELPTVWFLDGYDEIFLGNSRHPFNIYQSNDLDKWPNAHFVFTCRKKLLNSGDENNYFSPTKKTVKLLQVVPFEQPDVEKFLDNYIATKKGIASGWNKAKFLFAINTLGLSDVIVNPFFLRKIVDYLSELDPASVSDKKEKLDAENRDKEHSLLDLIISDSIIRESERTSGSISPKAYCELVIEIARLMQICQQSIVAEQTFDQQTEQRCQRDLQKSELEASRNLEMLEKVKNEKAIKGTSDPKTRQDLEDALAGNVSNIAKFNDDLKRLDLLFQAEQRLQTLLFNDAYRYLCTGSLIKQNDRGEKEFGHVVLYQYFVGLLRDDAAKQRLLNLCNATK